MTRSLTTHDLVLLGAFIGGGLVLALLLRFGLRWLTGKAERTVRTVDDVAVAALRMILPAVAFVGGVWLALGQMPLRHTYRTLANRSMTEALILILTLTAARLAVDSTRAITGRRSGMAQQTSIFANIVRVAVLSVGALVILQEAGVSITPLLTALGVGGLAVALALQDTLSNLFAGIHLLASKKIQPGDFITLASGEQGYVTDVNWRNTMVRALPDNMVLIPNALLASQIVVNHHRPFPQMSVLVQVGVSYSSDLDEVEQVTIDVAKQVMSDVPGGVADADPFIRYHDFGSSSIDFSVILRVVEFADQYLIVHEFVKRLHRRYRAEGIEIPFPIRTVVQGSPVPV